MDAKGFFGIDPASTHVAVVAEISNAHNGSEERAVDLIIEAQAAGADFVKFQAYHPLELIALRGDGPAPEPWGADGWTMRKLYEHAQTPLRWFPNLVNTCREVGMPWFASVFGPASLAMMEGLECPAYKLAALDYRARNLRDMVIGLGKPVVRSYPRERVSRTKSHENVLMLYCPPGYPQTEIHLGSLSRRGYDGFSYHGTNSLTPLAAVWAGARIIEVHVQLNAAPSELESHVSFMMSDFRALVQQIRDLETLR